MPVPTSENGVNGRKVGRLVRHQVLNPSRRRETGVSFIAAGRRFERNALPDAVSGRANGPDGSPDPANGTADFTKGTANAPPGTAVMANGRPGTALGRAIAPAGTANMAMEGANFGNGTGDSRDRRATGRNGRADALKGRTDASDRTANLSQSQSYRVLKVRLTPTADAKWRGLGFVPVHGNNVDSKAGG
jgi:hypothetical protein